MSAKHVAWGKLGGRPRSITPRMGGIVLRLRSEGKGYRYIAWACRKLRFGAVCPNTVRNWVLKHPKEGEP